MTDLPFRQIHLDFHTSELIPGIGEAFDAREFVETLKAARVNSINLFAKCHHGQIYYDTPFHEKHPNLDRDLLREQVEACRQAGIATPIYVSAGFDELAARNHPEWLERNADGSPAGAGPFEAGWRKLCFNTPYVNYYEAQVLDMLDTFGDMCDGVWVDIVAQMPCCCEYCKAGMLSQGMDPADLSQRQAYADAVLTRFRRRLTAAIRKKNDDCQIFYNSGHVGPYIRPVLDTYTHLELESLPGKRDIWSYDHFPLTVRYAKHLGVEYIGMTGKFHKIWGDFGGFRNDAALEYDCFTTLAHGAKCCVGDQLHPSGKIEQTTYDLIGRVYRQVEAKEPWCRGVEPVSEIGLFTTEGASGAGDRGLGDTLRGAYRMLEESHLQFDLIDAQSDFERYAVLILPDIIRPEPALVEKVKRYLDGGGKVLLSWQSLLGEDGFALDEVGVDVAGPSDFSTEYMKPVVPIEGLPDSPVALYGKGLWVKPSGGSRALTELWSPYFERTWEHFCSHFQTPYEKPNGYAGATVNGSVAYIAHPIFAMYRQHGARAHKMLALAALRHLLPDPIVVADAPTTAHINLNGQAREKRHVLHILHYIPEARSQDVDTVEDVIPLHNLRVSVRLPGKPARVYLAPSQEELEFAWEKGRVDVTVPEVRGHQMVVMEQ